MTKMTLSEKLVEAAERGASAGESNAEVVCSEIARKDFRTLLNRGEVDCPEWLSGEWAGQSISELLGDLIDDDAEDVGEQSEEICAAYEEAADEAFWGYVHSYASNSPR